MNYITRKGRTFFLRPKVLELGAAYLESMDIDHLTQTHLEELARLTGDSAALSVLDGNDIVYVARTSVRTLVRLEAHVGSRFPAHVTSMGRVLLAGISAERLEQYFSSQEFVPLTDRTVIDPKKIRRLIDECRRAGYSAVEDELAYGVVAVAVPVSRPSRVELLLRSTAPVIRNASPRPNWCASGCRFSQASQQITTEFSRVPGLALSATLIRHATPRLDAPAPRS